MRYRSIIAALSKELLGEVRPLTEFPTDKSIHGIGMSDASLYAHRLEKKFSYINTFYHKNPQLDITRPTDDMLSSADFIISSDVFEHVPPPVNIAFNNLIKILRQGGIVVFSVPYVDTGETIEHFPELHKYIITRRKGKKILINTTTGGETQIFSNLQFHGGCGQTLEMRSFSRKQLLGEIRNAGFKNIVIHNTDIPKFGIFHDSSQSRVITMRKN